MPGTYYKAKANQQQTAAPSSVESPPPEPEEEITVGEPVEVDSLADQESGILPAASGVPFQVKKASLKTMLMDNKMHEGDRLDSSTMDLNKWTTKSLHLELQILGQKPDENGENGSGGIDGAGAYIGKVLFADLILKINMPALKEAHARKSLNAQIKGEKVKPFNESWWLKESRYPTKQFYTALSIYDPQQPDRPLPVADDDFMINITGCELVADIVRVPDTYRGQGEFKNEVRNFRAVQG